MKEAIDIRLPRLMNLSLNEIGRVVPEKLSYTLSMSEPSTATLIMNQSEGTVLVGQFVELYETWGSIGIFRVEAVETTYKPGLWDRIMRALGLREASVTVTLKHAICTLEDGIIFGYHEYGGTGVSLSSVLSTLIAMQPTAYWQLGTVDFSTEYAYSFENESNLLAAILSTAEPLTDEYLWTFDFSTTPWTLSLKSASADICEMRMNRNAETVKVDIDRTKLVNRIYPLGYGEGANQLTIADANGGIKYLEDIASQATWGIVALPYPETTVTDAATLKALGQAQLDARKEPTVTVVVTGSDLSALTGETIDRLLPGRMCRVPLPDYGVTVNERVITLQKSDVYRDNTKATLTLANKQADSVTQMAANARKAAIGELYSQGAPNQQPLQFADNADASNPVTLSFYMDEGAVHVNTAVCRFKLEAFRGYTKGAAAGGASTKTTSSGGGQTVTSASTLNHTGYAGEYEYTGTSSGNTGSNTASHVHEGNSHRHYVSAVGTYSSYTTFTTGISDNTMHYHSIGSHTHTIGSHRHSMTHTHDVTINSHTHSVSIDSHTHDPVLGIIMGETATAVTVKVDGNAVPSGSIVDGAFDVIPYLSKDSAGKITRGTWHDIEITPNSNTRIVANLHVKTFVRTVTGGNY